MHHPVLKALHVARFNEPGVLTDGSCPGLRLEAKISKRTGGLRKAWFYRYRTAAGVLRQIKLGVFPTTSLEAAREGWRRAKAIRDDPAKGDPRKEYKARAEADKQASAQEKLYRYSVKELCEHYLTEHVEKNRKRFAEPRRMLEHDVYPILGKRAASEIKRNDIHELVQGIINRGAKRIAQMVKRELQAAYDHAEAAGRLPDDFPNPCLKVKAPPQVRRSRAFSEAELEKFLAWLPTAKVSRTVRDVMLLELLTTARQGEIVAMEWRHVDLERGVWTQPKTKNRRRHDVMLSRQAKAIVEARQGLHSRYVFPRPDGSRGPVASKAIGIQQYAAKDSLNIEPWTVHDLRRSALTGLSRMGCPRTVQDRVSNHYDASVGAIYDQHNFDVEARQWLQKWADHLDALTKKRDEQA